MAQNLEEMLTDELTEIREKARDNKDFALSDRIRNELDSRGSFCFDTPSGQTVYHLGQGYTRSSVVANIKQINLSFRK